MSRATLLALIAFGYLVETHLISNIWRLTEDHTLALRLFQLSAFVNVALLCWIILIVIDPKYLMARIFWVVAAVLETYTIAEYTACKILGDTYEKADMDLVWGDEVAKGSCDRVAGPFGSWAEPSIATIIILWLSRHWLRAQTKEVWRWIKSRKTT